MNKKWVLFLVVFSLIVTFLYAQKSPDEFFKLKIGSDKTLVEYPEIVKYFQHLDSTSDRVKASDEGLSTQKNPICLVFVSSKENISNLNGLIATNKRLANPDTISEDEVKEVLDRAKVFVLITATIHSTEVAASQMLLPYAYHLATTEDPKIMKILDQVVILLMPSINPDGNIMVTQWYKKYLNTEFEGCRMPYLYHHYAGHDTNRDYFMLNLKETQVVNAILHQRYFPHVFLDMHQMGSTGPRMFVPPFKDPLNQNLDPLLLRETDLIGTFMSLKLQEKGKKGVASGYAFDAYWPGGTKNTAWYKNVVGILTELASVNMASPIYIESNELSVSSKGLPEYKAQVNFPDPWQGGWWRLKDIIQYEQIAVEAMVEIVAKNRESFLSNFYTLGKKAIEVGESEPPSAYILPEVQWDNPALYTFLQKMRNHGVRIYQLQKDFVSDNQIFKKNSFVIPLNQPYGRFVKVMMEKQKYPEIKQVRNGPIIEPYDTSGWTLPLLMGVKYFEIKKPLKGVLLLPANELGYPEFKINGVGGEFHHIPARFNRSFIVINRLLDKEVPVYRYTGEKKIKKGDFVLKSGDISKEKLESLLEKTGVKTNKISDLDSRDLKRLNQPRIAIYQPFLTSMDEGWTRWVLDNFEFDFKVLHNQDFKDKKFSKKYDVLIFADMSRTNIVDGKYSGRRYYRSADRPPEFRGGIGKEGLNTVKDFVKQGGTLILLDSSSEIGEKDFELPMTNVLTNVNSTDFYCPGAILKLHVDPEDPLSWGMEKESVLFFSNSLAFRTRVPSSNVVNRKVAAWFEESGPHLISGYIKGEELLNRAAMMIRFDYQKGNIFVLGGRVQHRAQTFATFKFLFNSIYYSTLAK